MEIYTKILFIISIIVISIILFKFVHIMASITFFVTGIGILIYYIRKDNKILNINNKIHIPKYIKPTHNNTEELVIAICNEDVSWIDDYASKYKLITVYNKCDKIIKFKNSNIKVINCPNIGSCDYAYLSYIINRYDTLPDLIEFTKGWKTPKRLYNNCLSCKINNKQYNKLIKFNITDHNFSHELNNNNIYKWHDSGFENMGKWIEHQKYIDKSMYKRNMCNLIYGGQFGATKTQILKTPKKVWEQLRSQQKHPKEEIDHYIERTWGALLCKPLYKLVVVAIFKNEAVAIKEWLHHYIRQGVEHFYMIDNGSTDNWESQVDGYPVTIYSDKEKHKQSNHYNNYYLEEIKRNSEWVMIVDLDEFMYARNEFDTIPEYLDNVDDNVGQIRIRWKMFGSNGHIQQPDSIIKGFTKRKLYNGTISNNSVQQTNNPETITDHVKSICRTINLEQMHIHTHKHNGKEDISPYHETEESLLNAPLHLNHYAIQSFNWFKNIKMTRGSATTSKFDDIRTNNYFLNYDYKDIVDNELKLLTNNIQYPKINIKIPKIINKVFLNDDNTLFINEHIIKAHNSWIQLNNGYNLKLWSKKDCRQFLINNFSIDVIQTFDNIIPYTYKCDFFRYCLIYKEGGWFTDWEEVCLINNLFEKLCINNNESLIYFTDKDRISLYKKNNNKSICCAMTTFFGALPNNYILKNIIDNIVKQKYYGQLSTDSYLFGNIIKYDNLSSSCGHYKQNFYYHKNFGKIIQHK